MNPFENWFSANGFSAWKLGALGDYISVALVIVAGIVFFKLIIARINRNRTPERAAARVSKRLVKLGGKGSKVYQNVTIHTSKGDCPCEMLWMARDRLHPVRVIAKGVRAIGSEDSAQWQILADNKTFWLDNPLFALNKQSAALKTLTEEHGMSGIEKEPLVVFADNYETPKIGIKGFSGAVPYQLLGSWRRKHPLVKQWFFDTEEMDRVISKSFGGVPEKMERA